MRSFDNKHGGTARPPPKRPSVWVFTIRDPRRNDPRFGFWFLSKLKPERAETEGQPRYPRAFFAISDPLSEKHGSQPHRAESPRDPEPHVKTLGEGLA